MTLATLAKAYRKLLTDAIVRELQLPAPASGNKILYDGGDLKKCVDRLRRPHHFKRRPSVRFQLP
jgi:hypothetical protein